MRFARHSRLAHDIDVTDRIHAGQRQHDLAAAVIRRSASGQAGVSALRHDGITRSRTESNCRGHLLGIAWQQRTQGTSLEHVAPVVAVRLQVSFVGQDSKFAQRLAQGQQQRLGTHGATSSCSSLPRMKAAISANCDESMGAPK